MKKRIISVFLAVFMLTSIMSVSFADGAAMKPGTYTVSGQGFADVFTIDVTVSETAIESIEVTETHDSMYLGQLAQKWLADAVVDNQTTMIDAMSGATISSMTFLAAVRSALTEAGATADMFAEDLTTSKKTGDVASFEPNVIVVGGGLAGVVSAMTAVDNGAKVLLIEQTGSLGGTSLHSGGNLAFAGSSIQPASDITPDTFYDWLIEGNPDTVGFNPALARVMADNAALGYDDLYKWGMVPSEMVAFGTNNDAAYHAGQYVEGVNNSKGWFLFNAIQPTIDAAVEAGNLAISYNTKATDILTVDGVAIGVATTKGDFTADAVILASGGFADDTERMGTIYTNYASGTCTHDTGEMISAAIALGADTYCMDETRLEGGTLPITGVLGERAVYECAVSTPGFVFIGTDGTRIAAGDSNGKAIWKNADQNIVYILMDQEMVDNGGILKYGNAFDCSTDVNNKIFNKLLEEENCIWTASSAEELAAKAGLDGEALAATIASYNEACAAGEDAEFGRAPEKLIPLDGQLYLVKTIGSTKGTSGGIVINENTQVLASGEPIEGLYAAGIIVGSIAADGNRGFMGGCLILCQAFGHVAGVQATEYALAK